MANWIERFLAAIAVHKSNASAHHAKYTDAEVLAAIQRFEGIFWWNCNWLPEGMISSATSGTGSLTWNDWDVWLVTGATDDSHVLVEKAVSEPLGAAWNKKRYFRARVYIIKWQTQNIHIVTGLAPDKGSPNTYRHVGFKVLNDIIYGTVADGTTESTLEIETISAGAARDFEVVLTPGVEARFYVDGVDKGAITTNLPTGTTDSTRLLTASINNLSAFTKQLWIREVRFLQEA